MLRYSCQSSRIPVRPVLRLQRVAGVNDKALRATQQPRLAASQADEDRSIYADQDATWVDRHFGNSPLHPFLKMARVDRPIGTELVLYPGLWGLALAAASPLCPLPATEVLAAGVLSLPVTFTAGAFLMRSAGCTINDIWDRDIDGRVARTKQRPLASGRMRVAVAVGFLGAQLAAGLGLLLQLNVPTVMLGVLSVPLVVAYPLAKRFTSLPQLVLGHAMNYGVLMGWTAAATSLATPAGTVQTIGDAVRSVAASGSPLWASAAEAATSQWAALEAAVGGVAPVLPLYAAGICWTVVYDTIYAHQDRSDDEKLGLKSTALLFGKEHTKPILFGLTAATAAGLAATASIHELGLAFSMAGAAAIGHMAWQVHTADLDDRMNLTERFVSNRWVGLLVLAGLLGAAATAATAGDEEEEDGEGEGTKGRDEEAVDDEADEAAATTVRARRRQG